MTLLLWGLGQKAWTMDKISISNVNRLLILIKNKLRLLFLTRTQRLSKTVNVHLYVYLIVLRKFLTDI